MNDQNSCSKLEHNYTKKQVEDLAHASALYQAAVQDAVKALGTPMAAHCANIAAIATINLNKALTPFLHVLPEFLR